MPLPQLTETTIQQYATPQIFARGRDYYQQGRVTSLIVRGPTLYAEVEGSEEFPYLVLCTFDTDGPIEASCTCPYEWGGWCKQLQVVLPNLAERNPALVEIIDHEAEMVRLALAEATPQPSTSVSPSAARPSVIDPQAIRR